MVEWSGGGLNVCLPMCPQRRRTHSSVFQQCAHHHQGEVAAGGECSQQGLLQLLGLRLCTVLVTKQFSPSGHGCNPVCSLLRWHFNMQALWFHRALSFTDWIKSWADEGETPSKLQAIKATVSILCFFLVSCSGCVHCPLEWAQPGNSCCSALCLPYFAFSLLNSSFFAWQVLPMLHQHFILLSIYTRGNDLPVLPTIYTVNFFWP